MEAVDLLFREADRDGDGRIGPAEAQAFFPRFGLASTALGAIWQAVVRNPLGMARDEFQLSLRLISLLQRGAPMDSSTLQVAMTQPQPLPSSITSSSASFTSPVTQAAPVTTANPHLPAASALIPAADRAHYYSIWMKLLLPSGLLEAKDALELFSKSGLPPDDLNQIWAAADTDKDNRLSQEEFILAMHLVNQRRSALASAQQQQQASSSQSAGALRVLTDSVQAAKAAQSSLLEKSKALTAEYDEDTAAGKRLQTELEQLQEANKQLEAGCLEKQQQVSAIRTNVEAVKATLQGERQKGEALRASLSQLEGELQAAMAQYMQMQQELAQASQTLPHMEAQRAIMEQQLEQMRRQTQSNEDEIVKLQSIMQSQRDMAGQYQHMLLSQQGARDGLQQQIAEQNRQLEAMATAAATVQAEAQTLAQSLNEVEQQRSVAQNSSATTPLPTVPVANLFDFDLPVMAPPSASPVSSPLPFSVEQPSSQPPSSPAPPPMTTTEPSVPDSESNPHDSKRRHNRPLSTFWKSGGKKDSKSKDPKSPQKEAKPPKHKSSKKESTKKSGKGKSGNGGSAQLTEDPSGDFFPAAQNPATETSSEPHTQQDLGGLFASPIPAAAAEAPSQLPQGLESLFSSLSAPPSTPQQLQSMASATELPSPFAPVAEHNPFQSAEASQLFAAPPPAAQPAAPFGAVDFNPFSQAPQDALPPTVDFSNLFSSAS